MNRAVRYRSTQCEAEVSASEQARNLGIIFDKEMIPKHKFMIFPRQDTIM